MTIKLQKKTTTERDTNITIKLQKKTTSAQIQTFSFYNWNENTF